MTDRSKTLVSIVVPCYKQAHLLPEAIESALSQTYREIEVIVVDDGSPDHAAEVVARYPDVLCVQQENRGLGGARNTGFRASKGDYVLFLDADDQLTPNAVAAHLSCFAEQPNAGFVVGDIDNIDLDGSYLCSPRWPLLEGNVYEELLKANHVANTIAVMFRRSVFEQLGGFKVDYSPSEDVELLLRAARLFPSAHHRSTVANYRRYPSTLSRKGSVMLPAILRVMRLQCKVIDGNRRLRKAQRQGIAFWRDYFGKEAAKEFYSHIVHPSPRRAARSLMTLLWHVRGRLFVWPWKYWQRTVNHLRRRWRTTNVQGESREYHR